MGNNNIKDNVCGAVVTDIATVSAHFCSGGCQPSDLLNPLHCGCVVHVTTGPLQ